MEYKITENIVIGSYVTLDHFNRTVSKSRMGERPDLQTPISLKEGYTIVMQDGAFAGYKETRLQKEMGKWKFWFDPCGRRYDRMDSAGWRLFYVGLIRIHKEAEKGVLLARGKNYYGIIIKFLWWFPIDKA